MDRSWVFTLLTNDPEQAAAADRAGIDRIGLDLEVLNKKERQTGIGTWISNHCLADSERVFPRIVRGARFARTNPWHDGTAKEVDALLAAGAAVLMLPYFHTLEEIEGFSKVVAGRALVVALVETRLSLGLVGDIIRKQLATEIHFGLTDLGLQVGKTHTELLDDTDFLRSVSIVRTSGMPFGIAGFAQPSNRALPYDPDKFASGVAQLGASRALIARSFFLPKAELSQLPDDIATLRAFLGGPLPTIADSRG